MGEPAPTIAVLCTTHHAPTGWVCLRCGESLCPDCAEIRGGMYGRMVFCKLCEGQCEPILKHREFPGFRWVLEDVLTYPLRDFGWVGLIVSGFLLAIADLLWIPGQAFALTWLWAFTSLAASTSAENLADRPSIVELPKVASFFRRVAQVGAALTFAVTPACTYFVWCGLQPLMEPLFLWHRIGFDPVLIGLLALAVPWVPMVLMLVLVDAPFLSVVDPTVAIRAYGRLGFAGVLAAVVIVLSVCASSLGQTWIDFHYMPWYFPNPVAEMLTLYLMLVSARSVGWVMHVKGHELEFGGIEHYLEPVLGPIQPFEVERPPEDPDVVQPPLVIEVEDLPAHGQVIDFATASAAYHDGTANERAPLSRAPNMTVDEDLLSESDFQAALLQTAPPEPPGSVRVLAEKPAERGPKKDFKVEPE